MKKSKDRAGVKYFMEDANLYTLWVYSRPDFYPKKYFSISEITPLEDHQIQKVFNFLERRLVDLKVPFEHY